MERQEEFQLIGSILFVFGSDMDLLLIFNWRLYFYRASII